MKLNRNRFFGRFLFLIVAYNHPVIAEIRSLCVFDLLGANGPLYAQMKDYKIAALAWGVEFQLSPYLDEAKAAADFKRGRCDAVSFTGIQSRQFNSFTGTLDAMGALPSYAHLKTVLATLNLPLATPLMKSQDIEVAGIIPIGAAYLFVRDRRLLDHYVNNGGMPAKVKIAVESDDPAQLELAAMLGVTSVSATIAQMYRYFKTGTVDVTYGPAVVYEALELYKGMQGNGGVVRFPLAQLSLQIMIHQPVFPADFARQSRNFCYKQFDRAVINAENHELRIPEQAWIDISQEKQLQYHEIYRKMRLFLRDKGIYDGRMLTLMRRVRCKKEPDRRECTTADKE